MNTFKILLSISVVLIVGGFFCPPIGIIDGSVLTATGILLMFAVIDQVPKALEAGSDIKFTHDGMSAEIHSKK